MKPRLYIVIPCFNEEEVLPHLAERVLTECAALVDTGEVAADSRILFVDDGSSDGTWNFVERLHKECSAVEGLRLSRNRGHQNALLAGLLEAGKVADIVITMDADLQDDVGALKDFVAAYKAGAEIVYGVRSTREKDSLFKRGSAKFFYRLMTRMGVELIYNHADYRLMSRRAIQELENFKEVNLFLRGLVPMLGFQTATVEYARGERAAGKSKYSAGKMFSLAIEGITSCSVKPIRVITVTGFLVAFVSLLFLIHVIIGYFLGNTIEGWATQTVLITFFGGFQIMSIGLVGEYVGKIYLETKQRPRYIIMDRLQGPGDKI